MNISFVGLILGFIAVLLILPLECYSSRCAKNLQFELKLEWTLLALYSIFISSYSYFYHTLSIRLQNRLSKRIYLWNTVSLSTLIHVFIIFAILLFLLYVYWSHYIPLVFEKLKNSPEIRPIAIQWKTLMFSLGHWCDFLIALNLLPISRPSLLSLLKISHSTAVKYHQIVGTTLIFTIGLHGFSFLEYRLCHQLPNLLHELFSFEKLTNVLGIAAFMVIILIQICSLFFVRRSYFFLFMAVHHILAPIFLFLTTMHGVSNFYFTIPALTLYIIELCSRLFNSTITATVTVLDNGMIQMKIPYQKCKPGQYFSISVKELGFYSHPFSVARISPTELLFYIKPTQSKRWTKSLYRIASNLDLNTDINPMQECSPLLLATHNSNEIGIQYQKFLITIQGPYGVTIFDYKFDIFVAFVGGSGITSVLACLHESLLRGIPCFLFWAVRDVNYIQLPDFELLIQQGTNHVVSHVFYTGGNPKHVVTNHSFQLSKGRMDIPVLFQDLMETLVFQTVLVHTCGPVGLMDAVENSTNNYEQVIFSRELYEW